MSSKGWQLLPFSGNSIRIFRSRGTRPDAKPGDGDGDGNVGNGVNNLATHESAAEFAKKSQEDVVVDYNAPV